jgi:hypothetical protein
MLHMQRMLRTHIPLLPPAARMQKTYDRHSSLVKGDINSLYYAMLVSFALAVCLVVGVFPTGVFFPWGFSWLFLLLFRRCSRLLCALVLPGFLSALPLVPPQAGFARSSLPRAVVLLLLLVVGLPAWVCSACSSVVSRALPSLFRVAVQASVRRALSLAR